MVDHEDTSSTRSTSPTPREQEAERRHVKRMHFGDNSVRQNEQQKREREERYARRTRQRTTGEEENRNASEPLAVGSHTTKPNHQRSQSEGGGNDRTYKDSDITENNPTQEESKDKDDLIIGTPLGTYMLRTKGTGETTGTSNLGSGVQDKGKTPQSKMVDTWLSGCILCHTLKTVYYHVFQATLRAIHRSYGCEIWDTQW